MPHIIARRPPRHCHSRADRRPADQVYDAITTLAEQGLALLLEWDETSRLVVLRSGEVFRLDVEGVTRLG